MLKNGEWGTVCHDQWSLTAASVVCRELGFGTAQEAISDARLGQGKMLKMKMSLEKVKGTGRRRSKSLERQPVSFLNVETNIKRILQAQTKGPSTLLFHRGWTDPFGGWYKGGHRP